MKNPPLMGLACLGIAYGVALSLPATAANLTRRDGTTAIDNCNTSSSCTSVFTELALVLDGSNSITPEVFADQLDVYKTVFSSSQFYEEILAPLPTKSIAVSVFQFGWKDGQRVQQSVGWTLLDSQSSAENFANLFDGMAKMGGSRSPIANSIVEAHSSLRDNDYAGDYLVIDINSDGYDFRSSDVWPDVTENAYNDGIDAINAISLDPETVPDGFEPILDNIVSLIDGLGNPLISSDPNAQWNNPSGTAGFLFDAQGDLDAYQQLLANKIAREILPNFDPDQDYLDPDDTDITETVPEPSLLWGLLGLGLLGIVGKGIRSR